MPLLPQQPPAQDSQADAELPTFNDRVHQIGERIERLEHRTVDQEVLTRMPLDRLQPFLQAVAAEVRQWTIDVNLPIPLRLRAGQIRDRMFSIALELGIQELSGLDDQQYDWKTLAARSWERVDMYDISAVRARYSIAPPPTSTMRRISFDSDDLATDASITTTLYSRVDRRS